MGRVEQGHHGLLHEENTHINMATKYDGFCFMFLGPSKVS